MRESVTGELRVVGGFTSYLFVNPNNWQNKVWVRPVPAAMLGVFTPPTRYAVILAEQVVPTNIGSKGSVAGRISLLGNLAA